MTSKKPLVITAGEPAGIGPDLLVLQAARHGLPGCVVAADVEMLHQRAALLGVKIECVSPVQSAAAGVGQLAVEHIPLAAAVQPGQLDPANAPYVLATLTHAIRGCEDGRYAGLVTAPVHKGVINDAGIPFTGHTEFLAEQTATPLVVMMLVGGGLRVALATTHLPIKEVAEALTPGLLEQVLRILQHDLMHYFGVPAPRILVAGLNPHAGEGGHLGREEIDVIEPVLRRLRAEGMQLAGPLPADTLFTPHYLQDADAVLAMYHDQGLPVLKYASFGGGVNVTLGLPIIRTSVDHGTALELVGTGRVNLGSLQAALELAHQLVGARHG